jgi:hypothetical protein
MSGEHGQHEGPFAGAVDQVCGSAGRAAYRLPWIGQTVSSAGEALVQVALVFAIMHMAGPRQTLATLQRSRPSPGWHSSSPEACRRTDRTILP